MPPAPLWEDRGRVLHYQGEDRKPGGGGGSRLCGILKPQRFSHRTRGCDSVAQPAEPRHQAPKCWFFGLWDTRRGLWSHLSCSNSYYLSPFPPAAAIAVFLPLSLLSSWSTPPLSWGPCVGRGHDALTILELQSWLQNSPAWPESGSVTGEGCPSVSWGCWGTRDHPLPKALTNSSPFPASELWQAVAKKKPLCSSEGYETG